MMPRILIFALLTGALLPAQQVNPARRASIRTTGTASVSMAPDQARFTLAVTSHAATAQDAAAQNATQTTAVIGQVRATLGTSGEIKTVSYSITPNYTYPKDGSPPILTGYTATNSLQVIINDLSTTGRVIDTATQSGATRIDGLQFTLKDDQAARTQALRLATLKAKAKADGIAAGLGQRTGAVITVQESGAVIQPLDVRGLAAAPATPIQPGQLDIQATVTLEVEIL